MAPLGHRKKHAQIDFPQPEVVDEEIPLELRRNHHAAARDCLQPGTKSPDVFDGLLSFVVPDVEEAFPAVRILFVLILLREALNEDGEDGFLAVFDAEFVLVLVGLHLEMSA